MAGDGVEEERVGLEILQVCRADMVFVVGVGRALGHEVDADADARTTADLGTHRPGGEAMGNQQVVGRGHTRCQVGEPGGVATMGMPDEAGHAGFVDGAPVRHPITESRCHRGGVVAECHGRCPTRPAAPGLERRRQVPVVQRGDRCDPGREQFVHQPVVEAQSGRVHTARPPGTTRGHDTENR